MIRVHVRKRPDRPYFQLAYTCPITGRVKTKSAGTSDKKEAERAAAKWELEIQEGAGSGGCPWDIFRHRFEVEHLADAPPHTRTTYLNALNHFEREIGHVRDIGKIDASVISRFSASLAKSDLSSVTVAKILRHLRGALNWAYEIGLSTYKPRVRIPKSSRRKMSRGRPLTAAEVQRMIDAVDSVIAPSLADEWKSLIECLNLSGLRISEAITLSWDSPPVQLDFDGRRPKIRWHAEGQKNRLDALTPITPDFYNWLQERKAKVGPVFQLKTMHPLKGEVLSSLGTVVKKVSAIGRESGVLVSKSKHATAHDLRRTFGSRWALKVHPIVLKTMMRHSTIETTMKYYIEIDSDKVADTLWDL